MPRQKGPEVGFGIVPTGRYMGDVNGSVPNGAGPVIAGDFFIDRSTLPAVWVVGTGASLSSNATIRGIFSGSGSTSSAVANSSGNSSLYTGTGVVLVGTTTPSTPVAVSTAATSGFGLVARSSIAAPNVQWEHVELFGLSSLYAGLGQIISGSSNASTPLAVTAPTVAGTAPVYRSSVLSGLNFEIPNSTFFASQGQFITASSVASTPTVITAPSVAGTVPVYRSSVSPGLQFEVAASTAFSGQGIFRVGSTVASTPTVITAPAAGNTLIFRTSVAGGWNPETVAAGAGAMTLIAATTLAAAGAFSFTGISSAYNSFMLSVVGTSTTAAVNDLFQMRFNNDSGSNYDGEALSAKGTTVSAAENANASSRILLGQVPAATASGTPVGAVWVWIPSANSTTWHKVVIANGVSAEASSAGNTYTWNGAGRWRSSSNINRIDVTCNSAGFVIGSIATLYGVT